MQVIDSDKHCHTQISCLRNAGVKVVFRYYARAKQDDYPEKILTYDEAAALSSAGFYLGVCYQYNARSDDKFSNTMGLADGRYAREYAANTIQQPANSTIYFGVDYDVRYDAQYNVVESNIVPHFRGIVSAMQEQKDYASYDIGVYGAWQVCSRLRELDLVKFTWLSQSTGWGGTEDRKRYVAQNEWTILQKYPTGDLCSVDHDPNEIQENVVLFGQFMVPH